MTIGVYTDEKIEGIRATYPQWAPGGREVFGLLATIDALRDKLGRSFQCKHGRVLSSCVGCDTEWEAEVAARDAEIARLRELYQDEHDWATQMFGVVEAARHFCAMAPSWGHAEGPERLARLRAALANYGGGR